MSSNTFVPNYEGALPSKRQARRILRVKTQAEARQAKRLAGEDTYRSLSGLDRKAIELGIHSIEFMKLPRKARSLLVHKATSNKQAA